jgi:hypothetical protein
MVFSCDTGQSKEEPVFWKCANPDCEVSFDYRQGRFFRFPNGQSQREPRLGTHSVRHFWLCRRCADTFTLSYREGLGVLISRRLDVLSDSHTPRRIAAA